MIRYIPPIVINKEVIISLRDSTARAESVINFLTSGNMVIYLIQGLAMQQLWGTIRAMQMIVLTGLIRVPLPVHSFMFMIGAMQFAQMDVFDGQNYYE